MKIILEGEHDDYNIQTALNADKLLDSVIDTRNELRAILKYRLDSVYENYKNKEIDFEQYHENVVRYFEELKYLCQNPLEE